MKVDKITCKEVMHHICDNLGEQLDSPKCKEIKDHLESCDNCKQYFSSVEKTIQFYKLYNVELDPNVHKRLLDKLGLSE